MKSLLRSCQLALACLLFAASASAQCDPLIDQQISGGLIFSQNGTNEIDVCAADGPVQIAPAYTIPSGTSLAYVVTDSEYIITRVETDASDLDFASEEAGTYNIFLVNYTGTLSDDLTGSVYLQRWSDGCFRISANEIIVSVDEADAGDVTTVRGETLVYVCAGDGASDVIGFDNPGAAGIDYAYVITDANGMVLGVPARNFNDFEGAGVGDCRVYGVSYTGDLTVAVGDMIGSASLATGCSDLSDTWLTVSRSMTDGGSLSFNGSMDQINFSDTATSAGVDFDVTGQDMASNYRFFLLDSNDDILEISTDSNFDLTSRPAGKYFIYGFSYSGGLRLMVGDDFFDTPKRAEGCFDVSDNALVIQKGSPAGNGGGDFVCNIDAGALQANNPVDTIEVGEPGVRLDVEVATMPTVPAGYEVRYLLTYAEEQFFIVGDVYETLREAYVLDPNRYRLQILVGEFSDPSDPNYFDIDAIMQGRTTLRDIRAQFAASGICIALSDGVLFDIARRADDGGEVVCDIDAGALQANNPVDTIEAGEPGVRLDVEVATMPTVPAGYEVRYLLTYAEEQFFIVGDVYETLREAFVIDPNRYRLQILVGEFSDPSDPNYFDVDAIQQGRTTLRDIRAQFAESGICIALSDGVLFDIARRGEDGGGDVDDCDLEAGNVLAASSMNMLAGEQIVLTATQDTATSGTGDFQQVYLLTLGDNSEIVGVSRDPEFAVGLPGTYRIHSFVALTADARAVSVQQILDFAGRIEQNGGGVDAATLLAELNASDICFDLSAGAEFEVTGDAVAERNCAVDAGSITADEDEVDFENGTATITASVGTAATVPAGYTTFYLLTSGSELTVEEVSLTPSFTVTAEGDYTIHTVVAANVFNAATIAYVNTLIDGFPDFTATAALDVINGTNTCYALDVPGASFTVAEPGDVVDPNECTITAGTLSSNEIGIRDATATAGASAFLTASVETEPSNFEGCAKVFVLTRGDDLDIVGASFDPSFEVGGDGTYRIHTLIANQSDLGTITTAELIGLLSGGGELNAAGLIETLTELDFCFDLNGGTAFEVSGVGSESCLANAPFSNAVTPVVTTEDSTTIEFTTVAGGGAVVPIGSSVLYLLTTTDDGSLLEVGTSGSFRVANNNSYSITALVGPNVSNEQLVDYLNRLIAPLQGLVTASLLTDAIDDSGLCADYEENGSDFIVTDVSPLVEDAGVTFTAVQEGPGSDVNVRIAPKDGTPVTGEVSVRLVDYSGRTISARTVPNAAAVSNVTLPTQASTGLHAVSVRTAKGIESQNVIVE